MLTRRRPAALILFAAVLLAVPAFQKLWTPAPVTGSGKSRPLPSALQWRIEGLRARGGSAASEWTARVGRMYTTGAQFRPFRIQALKTLELEDFHVTVTERDSGRSSAAAVRDGVEKLSGTIALQTKAARVSVQDFHLDIRDDEGRLLCCLVADRASWHRNENADVELNRAVQISTGAGSWRAARAVISPGDAVLVAPEWVGSPEDAEERHPEPRSAEACPIVLAQNAG